MMRQSAGKFVLKSNVSVDVFIVKEKNIIKKIRHFILFFIYLFFFERERGTRGEGRGSLKILSWNLFNIFNDSWRILSTFEMTALCNFFKFLNHPPLFFFFFKFFEIYCITYMRPEVDWLDSRRAFWWQPLTGEFNINLTLIDGISRKKERRLRNKRLEINSVILSTKFMFHMIDKHQSLQSVE